MSRYNYPRASVSFGRRSSGRGKSARTALATVALSIAMAASVPRASLADEGGVSFWVPGFFGSLAATPQQPGWAVASIYYHTSVSAGGDVFAAREFEIGKVPLNLSATLNANLNASGDIGFVAPTYVFATPVLGGQASVGVLAA